MPGLPVSSVAGIWFSLFVIAAVGVHLLTQRERRRGDDRRAREPLGQDVDPVSLRRTRPAAARLSGTALLVAVLFIIGALRTPLGLG